MKFNLLYLLIALAIAGCFWIAQQLQEQGIRTFFGTAEIEGRVTTLEYPVLIERIFTQVGAQVRKPAPEPLDPI